MKRLRHPIRSLREPFGKAGLTVAILALVLAMVGGAWAAVGLNSKQKKQVTKIAKKYAGKPGAPGAPGTNGTNGTPGAKGDAGAPGATGKGVALTAITTAGLEGNCVGVGGTKVEVEGNAASKKFVCNGATGFTETLPSGKTETGNWSAQAFMPAEEAFPFPISYSIPLAVPSEHVVLLKKTETLESVTTPKEGCKYDVANLPASKPVAPAGTLCVFTLSEDAGEPLFLISQPGSETPGDTPAGAFLRGKTGEPLIEGLGELSLTGTWAVTAK